MTSTAGPESGNDWMYSVMALARVVLSGGSSSSLLFRSGNAHANQILVH